MGGSWWKRARARRKEPPQNNTNNTTTPPHARPRSPVPLATSSTEHPRTAWLCHLAGLRGSVGSYEWRADRRAGNPGRECKASSNEASSAGPRVWRRSRRPASPLVAATRSVAAAAPVTTAAPITAAQALVARRLLFAGRPKPRTAGGLPSDSYQRRARGYPRIAMDRICEQGHARCPLQVPAAYR